MKKSFLVETWMTTECRLSGNELVAFAYMWDVTKQGKETFTGGYAELSQVMNTTIPTVYNTIKKLSAKGMVNTEKGMDQLFVSKP